MTILILSFGDELEKLAQGPVGPAPMRAPAAPQSTLPRLQKTLHSEYDLKSPSSKPIRRWTSVQGPLNSMTERQGYKKYDQSRPTSLPKAPNKMPRTIPKVPGMQTYNI